MTKGTLRYRQSAGWSTKPAPNLDQNRLLAVEVDDNFIYLDKKISDIKAEHTTNINIAIDTANAAQAAAEVVADTLVNEVSKMEASIASARLANSNQNEAISQSVSTISAKLDRDVNSVKQTVSAVNTTVSQVQATLNGKAGLAEFRHLQTTVGQNKASADYKINQVVTDLSAEVEQRALLKTEVDSNSASITTISAVAIDAQNKVNAKFGAVLDVNGKLSGFQSANDGTRSDFIITADNVAISAGNLFNDENFRDPSAWNSLVLGSDTGQNGCPGAQTSRAGAFNNRDGMLNKPLEVSPGEWYKLRFFTANGTQTSTARGMFVAWLTNAGGLVSYIIAASKGPSSGWQLHEAMFQVPDGVHRMSVAPWIDQNHGEQNTVWYTGIRLWRATDGNLVVDGAITTNKLSAGAVTADKVAANSIKASHLQASSITADKLAVDSLSAVSANLGHVTAGYLSNGNDTNFLNLNVDGSSAATALQLGGGNFRVLGNGSLYANNAYIRGDVQANSFSTQNASIDSQGNATFTSVTITRESIIRTGALTTTLLPYVLVDSEGEEGYCLHYPGKPPHLIGMAHTSVDVASNFSWEVNAKEPIFTARAHAWFSDIDNIFYEQDVKVAMWAEATVTHPTHDQKWTNSSLALQGRLGIFIKVYAMVDAPGIRTLRSRPDIRISWALQRLT